MSHTQMDSSLIEDTELNELRNVGINVWGQHQQTLEDQALRELEICKNAGLEREDGELSDTGRRDGAQNLPPESLSLDVNFYIKRQEDLKKRQDHRKTLQVTERNVETANKISRKQSENRAKRKRDVQSRAARKKIKDECKKNETEMGESNSNANIDVAHEGECASGSDYVPSDPDSDYEPGYSEEARSVPASKTRPRKPRTESAQKVVDDGCAKAYKRRLEKYYEDLERENGLVAHEEGGANPEDFVEIEPGFKLISKVWNNLYSYQQDGLKWLWSLHRKSSGGLLGDEMGLGKTVQVIAFLYALNYSRAISNHGRYTGLGPTIVVCPSTVINQWVQHFFEWAPEFRVAVLHQSGSFSGNKIHLIKDINKNRGIIITTYQGISKYKKNLTELSWHYLILDEGHKIRNPNAKISVAIKEFETPHRLMLTGSPMQNNLQELWSLFDFIVPGMLGTLPIFLEHFANPIMHGGYTNATPVQEALALSIATALKDMISPFMLRRTKDDVKEDICLPGKSEQVLFCSLSKEQRDLYKGYLLSEHIGTILGRGSKNWFSENHTRAKVLMAITTLRKICNHPDVYLNELDQEDEEQSEEDRLNSYKRSGKMMVVSALLKIWKKQHHRVLLFTQSRAMIKMFGSFLHQNGYIFLKMDGSTAVKSRQTLIDKFNNDKTIDVFLLTTRVGGLGVNLTGANRVIIYDPDWNPATDTQARERAWRIGQDKEVTIYRLISAGTIEEKIYQRQVWKQLLSNKVLLDPTTQKFFKTSDLHDLFSLQEQTENQPETANIFQNSRISIERKMKAKKEKTKSSTVSFSDDKIEKMKQLAAQISKNITQNNRTPEPPKMSIEQREAQQERQAKLERRKELLKTMTPMELHRYNRDRLIPEDTLFNQLDDCETEVSFTKALVISEKTAELYNEAKSDRRNVDKALSEYDTLTEVFAKTRKHKKTVVDKSGTIDGEKVDGLVKMERRKVKAAIVKTDAQTESQDDYVLGKLFSKNGIHSALQHESIVRSNCVSRNSIRVHSETKMRTDLALQALTKSRVNKWRW